MTDMPELTDRDFARAIPARVRRRLIAGMFESGDDVVALRKFVGLSQSQFARAVGISVHTLRNWEQGRRQPEGPAIALLRIAAENHQRESQVCRVVSAAVQLTLHPPNASPADFTVRSASAGDHSAAALARVCRASPTDDLTPGVRG